MDYTDEKKYHRYILKSLHDSKDAGKLIPFIGAGFSKNVKGYPDWNEFIGKLSIDMGEKKYYLKEQVGGDSNYLVIATDYYLLKTYKKNISQCKIADQEYKSKLEAPLKEHLDSKITNKESKIHKYLLEHFSYIFTTNWDNLLESNDDSSRFMVIFDVTHLSEIHRHLRKSKNEDEKGKNEDEKGLIIKIHGTFDHHKSIIATEIDYLKLNNDRNRALNIKFQNEILHNDFLFLGFSFNDPNINNLSYPLYLIKKAAFHNLDDAPKMFMLSFSEYDETLAEIYNELKGIMIFFLDVAESDRPKATEIFLKDIVDKTFDILDKYNSEFKTNLLNELRVRKDKIIQKIKFLNQNIKEIKSLISNTQAPSRVNVLEILKDELNEEIKYLAFKLKKMKEKRPDIF